MKEEAKKTILVTGGAGYIGSITSSILFQEGYQPIIFDSLVNGNKKPVENFELVVGDLRQYDEIFEALEKYKPTAVIHFAGYKAAGESMQIPHEYYQNNLNGSTNLFKAMIALGIKKLVFSSSAAIYGEPETLPIKEIDATVPESVYGHTKLQTEEILNWLTKLDKIHAISLRYFNVAGAMEDGSIGEASKQLNNIVPILMETALGKREFTLFGDDYPTEDGTCVRDYIHVVDLAKAHISAIRSLLDGAIGHTKYNVGVGKGYSNKELIDETKKVSGVDFEVTIGERREGDPAVVYADSSKIQKELGWRPQYDMYDIIAHAWKWHSTHPNGYNV